MKEMLTRAWAQILLAFVIGILLIAYKEEWQHSAVVHHIGTAFVVAAIVTGFWHLREVSEIIHKYVTAILFDYSYLTKLKLPDLMELRSKAAKAILQKAADNPKYKRDELEEWIDELLYKRLLPGQQTSSGLYRQNYVEQIVIEYLTLEQALRLEGAPAAGISPDDLNALVMKVKTTTELTVLSPNMSTGESGYPIAYSAQGCGLANFPVEKLIKMSAGYDRKTALPVTMKTNHDGGQVLWEAEPKTFKFANGQCKVWTELTEFKSPSREPFVLNTMAVLTRNLTVSIQQIGKGPPQVFVGQMLATPSDGMRGRDSGLYRAWLQYDGWLFEDHGYHFHWFDETEDNPQPTAVAVRERVAFDIQNSQLSHSK